MNSRLTRYFKRKGAEWRMRAGFFGQFLKIKRARPARFSVTWSDRWPCFGDATGYTGFDRHYVFHTAWASRVLAETGTREHIDISSSLYFVANASAFVSMTFYDYRPAELGLTNLECRRADLTALPFETQSVASLSCMHVLEHVGLGRYGDPLDYDGDMKAAAELQRAVKPGGQLLVVVPLGGTARIQFNAHRIYTYQQVRAMFPELELREFSLIPDDAHGGTLIRGATERLANEQSYGCGCFHLCRPISPC